MTPEERKDLEARRKKLVKARDEALGHANQYVGGIALIDDLLKSDRVEIASFQAPATPAANGNDEHAVLQS